MYRKQRASMKLGVFSFRPRSIASSVAWRTASTSMPSTSSEVRPSYARPRSLSSFTAATRR